MLSHSTVIIDVVTSYDFHLGGGGCLYWKFNSQFVGSCAASAALGRSYTIVSAKSILANTNGRFDAHKGERPNHDLRFLAKDVSDYSL